MEWKTDITLETTLPLRKETIIYYCNFRPQFFLKILKRQGKKVIFGKAKYSRYVCCKMRPYE